MFKLKSQPTSTPAADKRSSSSSLPSHRPSASSGVSRPAGDPRAEHPALYSSLQIDRNALDENVIQQPELYRQAAELHVLAMSERDMAKERMSVLDAQLADRTRTAWSTEGRKFAVAEVSEAVQQHAEHQKAYEHWSAHDARTRMLGALLMSYEQRGKMLKEMSTLYVAGYFSVAVSRSAGSDISGARASANKQRASQQRKEPG